MSDAYVGEIKLFSFAWVPKNWHLCDGTALPINQNAALYSLIGTQYGGNGQTTFNLPDLRGRVPVHRTSSDTSQGSYIVGTAAGVESYAVTQPEMPGHTHVAQGTTIEGNTGGPGASGRVFAVDGQKDVDSYAGATGVVAFASSACTATTSGGQAHPNMQPFTVLNYCICISGYYPQRQ